MTDSADQINEQLSALVDDQLPENEQELLVRRLSRDSKLGACWSRYHLIRDTLRQQLPDTELADIAGKIRNAIENEPPLSVTVRAGNRFLKPLAGMAVAASVAVVAVLSVQNMQVVNTPALVASAEAVPASSVPVQKIIRVRGTRWDGSTPQVADRLNRYLVDHSEYAASGGMPGIGPHARIVGYDASR